ncbi:aldolase [Phaeobacter gallaeciensis]|uniref:Ribulose-5-phosphate 4-epimerase n=1 Tax=Phaeobacter gallaeciensis TaxID=60890 RepID=A0AAC9Z824_9RHOB|nr:aldolase [Phaeobacter gallaeciensis]AHD08912.1 Ribulose-5-phosphate 4-epimerase [Phaeobacter gallaeciensis DSM 26640]ATE92178.1 Ribulose-5-phosphate 4-epimerase [Phaeobacter gallaeciensis]ATE98003.1 Ribulose-5-phosphate 4-epimerase [Phaeobacter gallaeciensis]ATF00840.1 Ribulose-5-phosphate 4-epimerase [Phaeobacter gallaeciensis]ATF05220.1 Ribulose-5-phosphate 4-epimerase [Phaeobacter gallaeciensis]
MKTATTAKEDLKESAQSDMRRLIKDMGLTDRQKLALTCRILFDKGHDSGVTGQITCRSDEPDRFLTQRFGLGFEEITAENLIEVDQDLTPLDEMAMANPANRFHTWVYKEHPDVNCIIHTHPTHIAALSMLKTPLVISHMDTCALYNDCSFVGDWPGIPVGNEEGVLISEALGKNRALLLSHHGQLVTGKTIEEACNLAVLIERAAKLQLLAMAAGEIQELPHELAQEAHDWVSTDKRNKVNFAYYVRQALKTHTDCI